MSISAQSWLGTCLLTLALAAPIAAQQPQAASSGSTTPTITSTTASSGPPIDTNANRFPPLIEDGGISIDLIGWLIDARPILQGGAGSTATTLTLLDLPHESQPIPGVQVSIPAGSGNSVRISYFRLLGQGDTYAPTPLTISGTGYDAGNLLNSAYTLQMLKGTWDFLTYTVHPGTANLRVKTLWGVEYLKFNSVIDAPVVALQALETGNSVTTTALTEKSLVYPSLGIGLEQARSRYFRWEAKVSGFGIVHHAGLLDAEANAVLRAGKFDVLLGGKYYYFKTSPQTDEYFRSALFGPSIALRWYYVRGGQ